MTDRRIRWLTVFAAFAISMLACNQAIAQSALDKKMPTRAGLEKKPDAAAAVNSPSKDKAPTEDNGPPRDNVPPKDYGPPEDKPTAVNQKDQRKEVTKPATRAQKAIPKKKLPAWHVGDAFPTDDFGGGFVLKKNYDADRPWTGVNDKGEQLGVGTYDYLKQQVKEIKRGQRPGGNSQPAVEERRKAADNLKALGLGAIEAVPALAWSAVNERDGYVKRKAIEILGEIGGMLGIVAVSDTLLLPDPDVETVQAAEDALVKLIPTVGKTLTMNDAMFLARLQDTGNENVSSVIETTLAGSRFTKAVMEQEIKRRVLAQQSIENAKAVATAQAAQAAQMNRKRDISELPLAWQKWMTTPDAPSPNFADWFNRVPAGSGQTNAERRAAEIERQNRERAANRVR